MLDPQGKAIHHAVETIGYRGIADVRTIPPVNNRAPQPWPPGRYRMKVWHERTKTAEQVIEVGELTIALPHRIDLPAHNNFWARARSFAQFSFLSA